MKTLKKELQTIVKNLKSLTKDAERMTVKIDKLAKTQTKTVKGKAKAPQAVTVKSKRVPACDVVFNAINRNRKGIDTAALVDKTGYIEKKVRDIIYRLKKQGKVKSLRTGLYVKI